MFGMRQMDNIELLISQDEIRRRISEVTLLLDTQYQGEELVIIIVMKGAICIAADLIRELKTPCKIECVKASSYGSRGVSRGDLQITGLEEIDLSSKNVLLIDDIFDSGETISQLVIQLKSKNLKSFKSLVLLSKNVKRQITYIPDYILFEIENLFVVGFGLDYKEYYRGLPGIYILNSFNGF